jgi:undecaprenyl-diphosphatase
MPDKLIAFDVRLFLWLNGYHTPFWDHIMWFISGRFEWFPLYIMMASFLIYRYKWKSIWIILSVALAVTLADQIAVHLFKNIFMRPRPTFNPAIQNLVHVVNDYRGGTFGFVSNHAADTFAFATFMSFLFKNRYFTLGILIWAAIVSYSRIYLGVHYPADVFGGAMLGTFLGILVYIFYNTRLKKIGRY